MNSAVGYIRVSTEAQSRGASLDVQREAIARFADERRLLLTRTYIDILSGTRDDRPQYRAMLDSLASGTSVIVWRLDRIGRKKSELFRFFETCKDRRINLYSVTQPELSNALVRDILSVLAAYETEQLAERVVPAMTKRVEDGLWVSKAPTWLTISAGRLIPAEPFPGAAARCWGMVLATNNVSAAARAHGITYDALSEMIDNPAYCGDTRWNGLTVPDTHPALVPRALWEAVRARRRDGRSTYVRRVEGIALLTGLLYRADTDERLARRVRNPGTAWARDYYTASEPGATYVAVRCEDADETVVARLMELDLSPAAVREVEREARRAVRTDPAAKRRAALDAALSRLADERTEATRALLRGALTDADLARARIEQDAEERDLRSQRAALPPVPDVGAVVAAARGRVRLAAHVAAAWERRDIAALRDICRRYVARVELWAAENPLGLRAGAVRKHRRDHPARLHIVWL